MINEKKLFVKCLEVNKWSAYEIWPFPWLKFLCMSRRFKGGGGTDRLETLTAFQTWKNKPTQQLYSLYFKTFLVFLLSLTFLKQSPSAWSPYRETWNSTSGWIGKSRGCCDSPMVVAFQNLNQERNMERNCLRHMKKIASPGQSSCCESAHFHKNCGIFSQISTYATKTCSPGSDWSVLKSLREPLTKYCIYVFSFPLLNPKPPREDPR